MLLLDHSALAMIQQNVRGRRKDIGRSLISLSKTSVKVADVDSYLLLVSMLLRSVLICSNEDCLAMNVMEQVVCFPTNGPRS